jgi:biotin carboxyl carrier protein
VELIVRSGDREERVRVRRNGDLYEVTLGERTCQVEARAVGKILYSLRIDGSHHEVAVRSDGEGRYQVGTAQGSVAVAVADPLAWLAAQAGSATGGKRHERVDSYMPGRVVAVLAQEGEEVRAGQGIVVLEAMKMENEIRAEHDGVLVKIFVQSGQAVEGGDPLFELE